MLEPGEKELVKRAKKGDKAAFGKLVNLYYEMVYVLTFGVLKNREAAKDVTQDVFMKVFKDLHKFDGKSKFKTWLHRVSVNAAIDQYRKRKPTQSIDMTDKSDDEDSAPVIIESNLPSPRDEASRGELKELMKEALEKLSEDHKAVLVLREWQGLSYEEIAETLEIEVGTVMSRLYYARKKLEEALKKTWVGKNDG